MRNIDDFGENIEKIFYNDVSEKKKAARGVYAMTGKRGYVGKMITPVDYMTRKEKKEYIKGGEIMTTNFYEDIKNVPTLADIKERYEKDPTGTTKTLETIRALHSGANLAKYWGYRASSSVFTIWDKYGVKAPATRKRGTTPLNKKSSMEIAEAFTKVEPTNIVPSMNASTMEMLEAQKNVFLQQIQNQQLITSLPQLPQPEPEKADLFSIRYNRKGVTGEDIANRMSYIVGVLESDVKYKIKVEIIELEENEEAKVEEAENINSPKSWTIADELKAKGIK